MPHPVRIQAVRTMRLRDLLATAEHERRTARAQARPFIATGRRAVRPLIASLAVILVGIAFAVVPGALSTPVHAATTALNPEEAANGEIARRFFAELHDRGDLAVAEEIVASDAVFHLPGGDLIGPEGIGGLVTQLRTAFPDAVFPMEDVVVEGDTVAVRWVMRGMSEGEFQGIPPTGQLVELRGTAFLTIADGRIVEDWVTYDQLGLWQQLGAKSGADAERICVARSKAESSCQ